MILNDVDLSISVYFKFISDNLFKKIRIIITNCLPGTINLETPNNLQRYMLRTVKRFSSVKIGTAYEILTLNTLSQRGFSLIRSGSAGDKGIDLLGHWQLNLTERVNVIVQCKNLNKKANPNVIRDLISCVNGQIGILATTHPFSKGESL